MFKILALICATATPGAACDTETAVDVYILGEAKTPQQCGLNGQTMLALTRAPVSGLQYLKIVCARQKAAQ